MKKKERHNAIINIIENKNITTQEQLVAELNLLGIKVTQATISRDIKELKLIKEHSIEGSNYIYNNVNNVPLIESGDINFIIKENIIKINKIEYLIVLHTLPGGASTVAFHLDQSKLQGIIGTIAGDDTVLVITNDKEISEKLFLKWMR